ncbi:carbohydrate-binding family 9-like protein [Chondromyces crocatus]|uniref:Carbohydrate-binding domain-containing protein n=1 Tax=Chondromyces crocatus TaxID=52 RepID=A0A0K1E5P9_CHOCO|nr:carbohydrate-binding family 9-like protein [Chondromyces crocatus]AKT36200.1 uncharacterized protein CMC5_003140 [Chondromyces crocatus]
MRRLALRRIQHLAALALLVAACTDKTPQLTPEQQAKVAPYISAGPPAGMVETNVDFGGKIKLVGYVISPRQAIYLPGTKIDAMLVWRVEKPLDPGFELFTHLLDENGQLVLNVDGAGPLRSMEGFQGQPLPPSAWKTGPYYLDLVRFIVPAEPSPNLTIAAGIAHPQKGRLPILGEGGDAEHRTALLRLRTGMRSGRTNIKELTAHKLAPGDTITIDGRLDEPAWRDARKTTPFVDPHAGRPNPRIPAQGHARLRWDDTHLYVAFEVQDAHVTGGFPADAKDPHLWERDTVEIMIDPDGDGDNKDYYEIQISPQNLVFDSQFDDYNAPRGGPDGPFGHEAWSANLESAVVVHGTLDDDTDRDEGYTVEARIPWASFQKAQRSPPAPGDTWRMNFYAMQRNGGTAWSPLYGEGNFHRAKRFGRVKFALHSDVGVDSGAPAPSSSASATATPGSAPLPSASPSASAPAGPDVPSPAAPSSKPGQPVNPGAPPPAKPATPSPAGTASSDRAEPGLWVGHPDR